MNLALAHDTIAPKAERVRIDYTNWRGERRERIIKPIRIEWTRNEWHRDPQWVLWANDMEDPTLKIKTFALAGIHSFNPVT